MAIEMEGRCFKNTQSVHTTFKVNNLSNRVMFDRIKNNRIAFE